MSDTVIAYPSATTTGLASGLSRSAPIDVLAPRRQTAPVVFSSPHSGRDYPRDFVAASGLDLASLRRSEDGYVDLLFAEAPACGAPLLKANFPRAFVDANREPYELDPAMFVDPLPAHVNITSPRVAAGLGTIARVVAKGVEIYRDKLTYRQAAARIEACYRPYHDALAGLVRETRQRFGCCVVIDCHSMPTLGSWGSDPDVDFVLGDVNGRSCAGALTDLVEGLLTERGYRVRRNVPYPGGYITAYYGRPSEGLHSLQIEISRALYMDERSLSLNQGWKSVAADLAHLIQLLCAIDAAGLAVPDPAPRSGRLVREASRSDAEKRAAT